MGAGTGVVSQPHTVILHALGSIRLLDLLDLNNLTIGLLDLLQLGQKVPEARLCNDVVRSKNGHPEQWWIGEGGRGQVATHNSVLTELRAKIETN